MKTVKFYKNGTTVRVFDYDDNQVVDKLEPAIYTICQDLSGFYLNFINDKFEVPEKIYGSTNERANKILKTYDDRPRSTGVLMSGDKGSGKTMLSSVISNKMLERGLPVILVERPYSGPSFIEFINNIGECVLFFDEFAKVFDKVNEDDDENKTQNSLLSVFDGAHTIKRLILLTENETYNINTYMLNRPGRIYYHFKYTKLEETLVRQYCKANKVPENIVQAILLRIDSSKEFSFDALKAVVEEYLRFKEDIVEIFNNLNIEEPRTYEPKLKVVSVINTRTEEKLETRTDEVYNPSTDGQQRIDYYTGEWTDDEGKKHKTHDRIYINVKDLVDRNETQQVYGLPDQDLVVILEKQEQKTYPAYGRYLDV
jgi:KaiC/GvpD/RAD55 family RecA-like ATPase